MHADSSSQSQTSSVAELKDELIEWNDRLRNLKTFTSKPCYSESEIYQEAWELFREMCFEKYDFLYDDDEEQYNSSPHVEKARKIKRNIKVHFTCGKQQCRRLNHQTRQMQSKQWNSYKGYWKLNLFFESARDYVPRQQFQQMDYPYILRYQFKFFRQRCDECDSWGTFYIPQQSVECIMNIIRLSVQLIFKQYDNPVKYFKINSGGYKRSGKLVNIIGHQEDRCEACQLGECRIALMEQMALRQQQQSEGQDEESSVISVDRL